MKIDRIHTFSNFSFQHFHSEVNEKLCYQHYLYVIKQNTIYKDRRGASGMARDGVVKVQGLGALDGWRQRRTHDLKALDALILS